MRIAVIADMHGNCFAFEAVLADLNLHPVDQVVCLGDAVQGGAQPAETVARLRELSCPVVMGNADAWLLTGQETGGEAPATHKMLEIREWSLAQLSADDRKFIESFQPTVEVELGGEKKLLCFHGSPYSFDDVILPDTPKEEAKRFLGGFEKSCILTGGHTHLQQVRRVGDTFFFNPGSVGFVYSHDQPDDHFHADAWAEYAILTCVEGQTSLEFRRIPFDVEALIDVILSSGRPYAEQRAAEYRNDHQ